MDIGVLSRRVQDHQVEIALQGKEISHLKEAIDEIDTKVEKLDVKLDTVVSGVTDLKLLLTREFVEKDECILRESDIKKMIDKKMDKEPVKTLWAFVIGTISFLGMLAAWVKIMGTQIRVP